MIQSEFVPVRADRFEAFHASFDGESNAMWQICAQCGGKCEHYKIGTLMPGEKEYIAAQLGQSVAEFEARYLDRLVTPRGTVDVLKLLPGCRFLDHRSHCILADRKIKPVLCEVYPVVFEVHEGAGGNGGLDLHVEFLLDQMDCPLLHSHYRWSKRTIQNTRWAEYRAYFAEKGIQRLNDLGTAAEWYWTVAQYDNENFDYHALARIRSVPADQCNTFTLDDLLSCALGHDL